MKLIIVALPGVVMFVGLFTFMTFSRNMLFSYQFKQLDIIVLRAFAKIGCEWVCVCACEVRRRQQIPGTAIQVVVSHSSWVLETKPRSSKKNQRLITIEHISSPLKSFYSENVCGVFQHDSKQNSLSKVSMEVLLSQKGF